MKRILILVDDENRFGLNLNKSRSMDVFKIEKELQKRGYEIIVKKFSKIEYDLEYKDIFILFHITEDRLLVYKSYICDIILYLKSKGAILVPDYDYVRAHHNKVYMEMLRQEFKNEELKTIHSRFFGNAKEAINAADELKYPVVIKASAGSGSVGVAKADSKDEYIRKVKDIGTGTFYWDKKDCLIILVKKILEKIGVKRYFYHKYFSKIVVQNFIPNMPGDYKVLYFSGKYYTLKRLNRKNDFRASGSGRLFPVPDAEVEGILNFSEKLVKEIDFPIVGIDLGGDGNRYHLLEFQFVHLGPYTLLNSKYYHVRENGVWKKIYASSNLEEEYARSIDDYIKSRLIMEI